MQPFSRQPPLLPSFQLFILVICSLSWEPQQPPKAQVQPCSQTVTSSLNLCLHFLFFDAVIFPPPPTLSAERPLCVAIHWRPAIRDAQAHANTVLLTVPSWIQGESLHMKAPALAAQLEQNLPRLRWKAAVTRESSRSRHSANKQHCKESNERQQLLQPHKYTKEEEEEEDRSQAAANPMTLIAVFWLDRRNPLSALPYWHFQLFRTIIVWLRRCSNQSFKFNSASSRQDVALITHQ